MKTAITLTLAAISFSASAERVCTEVIGVRGNIVQACKNVPDNPPPAKPVAAPKPVAAKPEPVADVPESDFGNMTGNVTRRELQVGVASSAALRPLTPSSVGKSTLNLALASYGGESAIGVAFAHRASERWTFSAGFARGSTGSALGQVAVGVEF